MSDQPVILIHARGRQTPDECDLWNRLHGALQRLGASLVVIGHHPPQTTVHFDMRQIENGLDHAPAGTTPPHRVGEWSLDDLLERERFWWGAESHHDHVEKRRQGIGHFVNQYSKWLDELNPTLVVIWNGHHPQEIILEQLARKRSIPIGYIERGPLPGTLHFDTKGVLAGSTVAEETPWSWDSEDTRIHWRSMLDEFLRDTADQTWWPQPDAQGGSALRQKLSITPGTHLVCFAGQVDRDLQNLRHNPLFSGNVEAFHWIANRLGQQSEPTLLMGKHHPKSDVAAREYEEALKGTPGIWLEEIALADGIEACDRFVAVNSTSLFEAMFAGKPTLTLGQSLLSGKGVAYEISSTDTRADKIITAWLRAEDWPERQERFLDFCASLLQNHLFVTHERHEGLGLRGVNELAAWLWARTMNPTMQNAPR